IAKPLDADAQRVKGGLRTVAQRAIVQLSRRGPALKRKMLEQRTPQAKSRGARRQRLAPLLPLFSIKFLKRSFSFVFLFLLAICQNLAESPCHVRNGR